jgi:hypothetical protein
VKAALGNRQRVHRLLFGGFAKLELESVGEHRAQLRNHGVGDLVVPH